MTPIEQPKKDTKVRKFVKKVVNNVERYIIKALIILMSILLIAATFELAYQTVLTLLDAETLLISVDALMDLFSLFLLVLIGIELLDTIKVYFKQNVVHVEVVILVAIIAIARKVIVMDFEKYSGLEIIGIGFIVLTLTLGYYLVKKSGGCQFYTKEKEIVEIDPETNETEKKVEETITVKEEDVGEIIKDDKDKLSEDKK